MTAATLTVSLPVVHRFNRDEYYAMADAGLFEGRRVALMDGEIIDMPSQKSPHAFTVMALNSVLPRVFDSADYTIRCQAPLIVSDFSEPEPDLVVLSGPLESWRGKDHPTTALLVIEVADSTLRDDRHRKCNAYASAGIQEYWIINLVDRNAEVYRNPKPVVGVRFGHSYDAPVIIKEDQKLHPLAKPDGFVLLKDILP